MQTGALPMTHDFDLKQFQLQKIDIGVSEPSSRRKCRTCQVAMEMRRGVNNHDYLQCPRCRKTQPCGFDYVILDEGSDLTCQQALNCEPNFAAPQARSILTWPSVVPDCGILAADGRQTVRDLPARRRAAAHAPLARRASWCFKFSLALLTLASLALLTAPCFTMPSFD
eukprot:224717-Rhodomonas_salina.2